MRTAWQDLAYAARILRRSPGFTAVAVLTLALGIGANSAIFSFVDAWLIKPLPYPQADRLMVFLAHDTKQGWISGGVSSTADLMDFEKQSTSFEQVASWTGCAFSLTGDGPPQLVDGGKVSWNFFETLGAKPILGRAFLPADDDPGAGHVAILARGLWQSRYGGDEHIIGRTITISGEAYSVVGVMPASFQFPLMGTADMWTPLALSEQQRADRDHGWLMAFGRLKPHVSKQQADAEAAGIFARLEKQFPKSNTRITMLLSSMTYEIEREEGTEQVMICLWIVGLVLLIACANVANLMLAQGSRRTREFALRGALGATKGRLVRQLLTESLLLFAFGAAVGALFGSWGVAWIEAAIPTHIRGFLVNYGQVHLDFATLAYTLGIALLCGLLFGVAPAFESARVDINATLKETSGQSSAGRRGGRVRRAFVVGEVALAVVVLIATTLLVKSFIISVRGDLGFNAANVITAQVDLPATQYSGGASERNFAESVLARLRAIPGIVSAGAASALPYGGFGRTVVVDTPDNPPTQPGETRGAQFTAVSGDYFSAMQMKLLRGRVFNFGDALANAPVVVINERVAQTLWPNGDPIGRKIRFGDEHTVATVVGIVGNIKMYQLRAQPQRQIYVALAQYPSHTLGFAVRTTGDPARFATSIRSAIWEVDPNQPISGIDPLSLQIAIQDTANRTTAKLMLFFGAVAAFLGAIGIFGVMAQTVAQRTREIGIRMALGAEPGKVTRSILVQGLKLALVGVVLGIGAAFALTRELATMLYQVQPNDLATFVIVPMGFAIIAMAACYLPARRAMRVDPMVALRHE